MRYIISLILCLVLGYLPAQIVNIEDRRSNQADSIALYELLELGVDWRKDKREILNINVGAQVEFQHQNRSFISLTKFNYSRIDGENYVNSGFQHLRYNQKWNKWLTYEAYGQVQYNEQLYLKLRALLGTGVRMAIISRGNQHIYTGVSYMYEYNEETVGEQVHQDNRLSSYLAFSVWPIPTIKIASTTYYQPLLSDFSDFRLTTQTKAIFDVSTRMKLTTTFSLQYDSRAPVEKVKLVHRLRGGIRYEF